MYNCWYATHALVVFARIVVVDVEMMVLQLWRTCLLAQQTLMLSLLNEYVVATLARIFLLKHFIKNWIDLYAKLLIIMPYHPLASYAKSLVAVVVYLSEIYHLIKTWQILAQSKQSLTEPALTNGDNKRRNDLRRLNRLGLFLSAEPRGFNHPSSSSGTLKKVSRSFIVLKIFVIPIYQYWTHLRFTNSEVALGWCGWW